MKYVLVSESRSKVLKQNSKFDVPGGCFFNLTLVREKQHLRQWLSPLLGLIETKSRGLAGKVFIMVHL